MNKLFVIVCLLLGLCGCIGEDDPETFNPHSVYYDEEYTVEEVITAFDEVVLASEYSDGTGDVTLVQKWEGPIYYQMKGHTKEDEVLLEGLFAKLNTIEGFPGIYKGEGYYNLTIDFYSDSDFYKDMGHIVNGSADGAVQYWYDTEMNFIYEGHIGYRSDMDDDVRESVILEEVINLLGITDTEVREDSITYQYSSTNNDISQMDWIIIKLLYSEEIKTSMNAQSCHEIIKKLYY